MTLTSFPPRFTPRHPWAPMTDPEWAALSHWLTPAAERARRGRLAPLSALPCHPAFMPRPDWGDLLLRAARLILADPRRPITPGNHTLLDICIRHATGEPRRWRTTD